MEKQNQSGECKFSSDSLEIDRLTAAAIARSWLNELIRFTEYWRVSDASCLSLFPSRRDVWVRAVLEGDVTDQDSLPRGHWGHESCMQGSNQYWPSAFKACISSSAILTCVLFAAGKRSSGHCSRDGETRRYNRRNWPRRTSGALFWNETQCLIFGSTKHKLALWLIIVHPHVSGRHVSNVST